MESQFVALLHGLGPETKAALIQAIATVGSAIVGFAAIFWQIGRQAKQSRKQVVDSEGRRLKSLFYDEVAAVCSRESDKNIEYTSWLRGLEFELKVFRDASAGGLQPPPFSRRIPDFQNLSANLQNAAVEVIFLIERRMIFDVRMDVFRTAINVALHDLRIAHQKLFTHLIPFLPAILPNGSTHPGRSPTPEHLETILALISGCLEPAMNLSCWLSDFLVAMQNLLLGEIFEHEVPIRQPIDPKDVVITLNDASDVEEYFSEQTNWGKEKRRIEAEVRALHGVCV